MEDGPPPPPPPKEDGEKIKVGTEMDPEPSKLPQYPIRAVQAPGKKDNKEASTEDIELMEKLELAVERLADPNMEVRRLALELLRKEIRESTRCVP